MRSRIFILLCIGTYLLPTFIKIKTAWVFYHSLKGVSAQHNQLPNIYIHHKLQSGSSSNCLSVLDKTKECQSHLLLYTPWHAKS